MADSMIYLRGGWVRFMRSITNTKTWDNPNATAVYAHCLMRANINPEIVKGVPLDAGQFITSTKRFAEECNLSEKQMRSALDLLESDNLIKRSLIKNRAGNGANNATRSGTIITVVNYGFDGDQGKEESKQQGKQPDGQPGNSIINIINKKNESLSQSFIASEHKEELREMALNSGFSVPDTEIDRFCEYYKNEPLKNPRKALLSWIESPECKQRMREQREENRDLRQFEFL